MGLQNGYNATRLFLFSGKESITASEFKYVEDFRQMLLAKKVDETVEHTISISIASRYSTKEDFTTSAEMRHIVELLDIPKGTPSVIVGTIIAICEDEGWWYLGCGKCKKKVDKASNIVDLESDALRNQVGGPTEWWCTKCEAVCSSLKTMFRLQISISVCDKYGKVSDSDFVPPEITKIVGTKFAFKIFMDKFNETKLLPVFNVMRMSADKEIIETLHANATPVKQPDNEASSGSLPIFAPFTDDNTTPTNIAKFGVNNKRSVDDEAERSMSFNGKKADV